MLGIPMCGQFRAGIVMKNLRSARHSRARDSYRRDMSPAAALPSFSDPSILAFGAAMGGFLANTMARALGRDHAVRVRWSLEGTYYGTAIVLGAYLLVNAREAGIL